MTQVSRAIFDGEADGWGIEDEIQGLIREPLNEIDGGRFVPDLKGCTFKDGSLTMAGTWEVNFSTDSVNGVVTLHWEGVEIDPDTYPKVIKWVSEQLAARAADLFFHTP